MKDQVPSVDDASEDLAAVGVGSGRLFSDDPHAGHSKRKFCCCGGHNQWNHKKKKGHHATAARLLYKQGRRGASLKGAPENIRDEPHRGLSQTNRITKNVPSPDVGSGTLLGVFLMSTKPHYLVRTLRDLSKEQSALLASLLSVAADELEKTGAALRASDNMLRARYHDMERAGHHAQAASLLRQIEANADVMRGPATPAEAADAIHRSARRGGFSISREWCEQSAKIEGDSAVSAGGIGDDDRVSLAYESDDLPAPDRPADLVDPIMEQHLREGGSPCG